ncbi:hypothetical protein Emed_006161 [Eimeria media]
MKDVNTSQQAPPEEDVADNLQEGSLNSSEDEEAASSADDSSEWRIEPDVVKAMRRLAKHRASLIPLALLASALVLALVVRRRMHPVEDQNLVKDVVQWVKEAPVREDRSLDEEGLWNYRFTAIWRLGGVKYDLLVHFKKLTPAYDAEKTATELEHGISELFERSNSYDLMLFPAFFLSLLVLEDLYEEHARESEFVRLLVRDFGYSESGQGTMSIQMSRNLSD